MVALHTTIAIVLVIALIIKVRIDPVISLILGSLYLGLASGVGFAGTIEAITTGFGGIMAEVGLLIGFGVLIGALLHSTGAFRRLVGLLVQRVGSARLPYALTSMLAVVMPSIYVDVQVVLAAPVARSASPFIGKIGLPVLASALGCGIFAGYVFVIPGLAAISIAGLLDIRLGDWLVYGVVIGLLTALVSTLLMRLLFHAGGFWDPETDEEVDEAMAEQEAADLAYLTGEAESSEEALARGEASAAADEGAPVVLSILLAWFIAAVLHLAIGSVSVAAITAAGIIAPILDSLTISPIAIGLAIASGAMFALQVNSNFFWMFKSLLGLSTKGTLKTLTLVTSVASVVSLPLVMLAAVVL